MKPRQKRLAIIGGGLAALAVVAALVLNAFEDNLLFVFSPTQVYATEAPLDRPFRIGGLVEATTTASKPVTTMEISTTANCLRVSFTP